ncbi:MAG TPA: pyridoxal-phosphate dependent enzyme [bacterium]|nr:pyridoxal-phosphate dependent enzyme [bacterium]HPS29875.1 pyridoxal-phosphate dependent enzyme [bacterium]
MIDIFFKDIVKAHELIRPFITKTPVMNSRSIDEIAGCQIFFKCENFQKAGAFKFRGATNAVMSLSDDMASKGVCTHSSGNHAAALALAAKLRNIKALVVMPKNAPLVKKENVRSFGAEIFDVEPTLKARIEGLEKVVAQTGAVFIHPYDNPSVIAGQGTAIKELMEEIGLMDAVITPVGGGGLLSGTSIASHGMFPEIEVYAGEPAGADDAFRSLKENRLLSMENPQTIADGLRTSLSERTFSIIKSNVKAILPVEDELTLTAMKMVYDELDIIIEPSSAVPLAAILKNREIFARKKVGLVISGGNVDRSQYDWLS